MSGKQHVKAKLKGYGYPIFPHWIDQLNRIVDELHLTGAILAKAGGSIEGYLGLDRPVTSDGYGWFWGLKFSLGLSEPGISGFKKAKRILITLPWSQNRSRMDGLELDRSIAVYTRGPITPEEVDGVLCKLIRALKIA